MNHKVMGNDTELIEIGLEMRRRFLFIGIIGIALLFCPLFGASAEDEKASAAEKSPLVVARGDGFVVTTADMERVREVLKAKNYETVPSGYRNTVLEIRLFAKEAEAMGLEVSIEGGVGDAFDRETALAQAYFSQMMEDYPLEKGAVETYRLANPDKFQYYDEAAKSYQIKPLDEALRKEIRNIILAAKMLKLRMEAFERLKKKYDVVLCDLEKGCDV